MLLELSLQLVLFVACFGLDFVRLARAAQWQLAATGWLYRTAVL